MNGQKNVKFYPVASYLKIQLINYCDGIIDEHKKCFILCTTNPCHPSISLGQNYSPGTSLLNHLQLGSTEDPVGQIFETGGPIIK